MFPIEAFQSTITKAATILRHYEIRFHLTGGITSMVFGEPRMAQEIDLVVDPQGLGDHQASFLASIARSDFLFNAYEISSAIKQGSMFQLLDRIESLKLDLYPRELIPGELARSIQIEVFPGLFLPVASQADTAIAKLIWISKGSHKNRRDLRQIFRMANQKDRTDIESFATRNQLDSLLAQVLNEPDEIRD
jgi:hypothetical protein